MIQDVFGQPVELTQPYDFSFLLQYGQPFTVQAQRYTGMMSFGVESAQYGRLLVRFAGAPLADAVLPPLENAVRLYEAMPVYEKLYPHPALIRLQGHGAIGDGYAALFRWEPGENLQTRSAQRRLEHQPLISRLRMLDTLFDFHAFALSEGFLAANVKEDGLLADFDTGIVRICDIDRYRFLPAINDRGRLFASPDYLAPEEYVQGAVLDGQTVEYAMGALAFFFLAENHSREARDWTAGQALYKVAVRACSAEREKRYSSYPVFLSAWREAVGQTTL